jgi:hypothetical protein
MIKTATGQQQKQKQARNVSLPWGNLGALGLVVAALRALGGVDAARGRQLLLVVFLRGRPVQVLLEHGLGLDGLELGLEVLEPGRVAAAVGAAAGVGQVEALVLDLFALDAPVCIVLVIACSLNWFDICVCVHV